MVWDCLRLTLMGTVVLSVLVATALAIKPLADGLLSPFDAMRFVLYSAPTLVGFTIPFCAAFGATMVFLRMNQDSELMVLSTSGLSYLKILLPILVMSVVLAAVLLWLSHSLVPEYLRTSARLVQRDVAKMLLRRVGSREPLQIGNLVIHADHARVIPESRWPERDEEHRPVEWLALDGVAIGEINPQTGLFRTDFTAATADLLFYELDDESWVSIHWRDAAIFRLDTDTSAFTEAMTLSIQIDSPWREKPDFFTLGELRAVRSDPELFSSVRSARRQLIGAVERLRLTQLIERRLGENRSVTFRERADSSVAYELQAPSAEADRRSTLIRVAGTEARPVRVDMRRRGMDQRRWTGLEGSIEIAQGEPTAGPPVIIRLFGAVTVSDWQLLTTTGRRQVELRRMQWPERLADDLERMSLDRLRGYVMEAHSDSSLVQGALGRLDRELVGLDQRTLVMLHHRAAAAVSGGLLLFFSAILAIRLRGRLPLVVYLIAFGAALAMIMISHSGKTLSVSASNPDAPIVGIPVLWSGCLALLLVTIGLYRQVIRH